MANVALSGKVVPVECVCPVTGEIYQRLVEVEYAISHTAWRRGGYLVITKGKHHG